MSSRGGIRPRSFRLAVGLACAAVILLGTAACGPGAADVPEEPAGAAPDRPEVFFPRQSAKTNAYAMAEIKGELTLDDGGCLRIRHVGGLAVPVWPPGFGVRTGGEGVRVINRQGEVAARVGEGIYAGGGSLPSLRGLASVDHRTARDLERRCPGTYWLSAPDVGIVKRP